MSPDSIITATPSHAVAMAVLHGSAFGAFAHESWDTASFANLLGQPGMTGLIDPRGGMVLFRIAADEAEIITLAVTATRQGIGGGLVRKAMELAAAAGAKTIYLEVACGNLAAKALYTACGFAETGRRPAYYADGADALVLSRGI